MFCWFRNVIGSGVTWPTTLLPSVRSLVVVLGSRVVMCVTTAMQPLF